MRSSVLLALPLATAAAALSLPLVDNVLDSVGGAVQKAINSAVGLGEQEYDEEFLVELAPGETRWVTEGQKWALRREGKNFMDITEHRDLGSLLIEEARVATPKYPKKLKHNGTLSSILDEISEDRLRADLTTFSSFHTRYYKSSYGAQSSAWLLQQVTKVLADATAALDDGNNVLANASAVAFPHPWGQSSVIARIPGRSNKTVVIGAHQDSINLYFPALLAAPGADDDGSGTVTILEALRGVLRSPAIANATGLANTLEFHWYSAEEGGLLGSQAVFSSYARAGRDVAAMLQQDMTGYVKGTLDAGKPEAVGVITDFVDKDLTEFITKVVDGYCTIPWVPTKCGYACSDHASATKAGYPSAFVIESEFRDSDHNIHSTEDTLDRLSFAHMRQHARMTLGFAYELGTASLE